MNGRNHHLVSTLARRRAGFTLIEVLATILLLSIALMPVMSGIMTAARVTTTSKLRTEATALAETQLNLMVATSQWNGGSMSDTFTGDWAAFSWTAELNSNWGTVGVNATNQLQELDVHVKWMEFGKPQQVTVSTLVYQSANVSTSTGTGGAS